LQEQTQPESQKKKSFEDQSLQMLMKI